MNHSRLGRGREFDLIRRILARDSGAHPAVRTGPGDDCAVVIADGVALTADMSVEGVHFRRDWLHMHEIGYRATAASLSDLAAVAAAPIGILASIAVPRTDDEDAVVELMSGATAAVSDVGGVLLGGDITRTDGPLVMDVVAVGSAREPVLRSGARPGDRVWVTGRLGAAAAAVHAWQRGETPDSESRAAFAHPRPRIREALWLSQHVTLTAMADVSDGLAGDAGHIAAASGVRVLLDAARVPIAAAVLDAATDRAAALRMALGGGEDYELCMTAPAGSIEAVAEAFQAEFGVTLSCTGIIEKGAGVGLLLDGSVQDVEPLAYDHFRRTDP